MNYTEVLSTALGYADRSEDADCAALMPGFLRMVESRVNRVLQTRRQCTRAWVPTVQDQASYCLPPDFAGMRHCELKADTTLPGTVMEYVVPTTLADAMASGTNTPVFTIVENNMVVWPRTGGYIMEIWYYQRLVPLTSTEAENWLSKIYPDAYVQGLLVEINAWAKDPEAAAIWDARFKQTLAEMDLEDQMDRWSGPPLAMRTG